MRAQVVVGDLVTIDRIGDIAWVVSFRFADVRRRGRIVERHRWAVLALDSSTAAFRLTVPVEELRTLPRVRLRRRA